MWRRKIPVWLAAIALGALSFSPTVAAAPEHSAKRQQPYLPEAFEVPATNGYHVEVHGIPGTRGEHAKVDVFAWNETSATSYIGPGQVEDGRIRASLGRFGRVDVSFKRSGKR